MPTGSELRELSDEDLAGFGHSMPQLVEAEFARRQTVLMRQSGEDQKRAADATVETAVATKANARYMLWSVIVLAAASVLNLILTAGHP